MDSGTIQHFLKGKTILVTGATGFLAKVFVEKVLRAQPEINKLYLLLRASNTKLATNRMQNEVIQTDLFRVLRDQWGEDFDSFISKKVVAVAGDVSLEDLGLKEASAKNEMLEEMDIIVNSAASTKFNERFDISMGVNTIGAINVLNFAKNCHKIQVFLHISTAYVCGEAKGKGVIIHEEPFQMGQTLTRTGSELDIYAEKYLLEKLIDEIRTKDADESTIKNAMKEYGIKRANLYGWPNTYVFTKAMGEMLLVHLNENVPLMIIRPTMVTGTYKDPFPGWIEGLRTLDCIIGAIGKGNITRFLGHPNTILDVIPADMVINFMVAAIATHSNQPLKSSIYHVASSSRNPLRTSDARDICYRYFMKTPCTNEKSGKPITVSKTKLLTSMVAFKCYMKIRYELPLKVLNLASRTVFSQSLQDVYSDNQRKIRSMIRVAELYRPYAFFKAVFDDTNTEMLRKATKSHFNLEGVGWDFDPETIDWTDYMMNAHIPGLVKYAMK